MPLLVFLILFVKVCCASCRYGVTFALNRVCNTNECYHVAQTGRRSKMDFTVCLCMYYHMQTGWKWWKNLHNM